jgi:hypothetical protein
MQYTIDEHPLTHLFAFVGLPHGYVEGDELLPVATDQWFSSREAAIAALPALLDLEDLGWILQGRTRRRMTRILWKGADGPIC